MTTDSKTSTIIVMTDTHKTRDYFLIPCCAVCMYYKKPLKHPSKLILEIAKTISTSLNITGELRLGYLNAGLDVRHQATTRRLHLSDLDEYRETLAGECRYSPSVSCYTRQGHRIDNYTFNHFIASYSSTFDWTGSTEDDTGGPCVIIGIPMTPKTTPKNTIPHTLIEDLVSIASRHAPICHGVVDLDHYIANRQGYWYETPHSYPALKPRITAAKHWGTIGGPARSQLTRDPREAVIIGPQLLNAISNDQLDSLANDHQLRITQPNFKPTQLTKIIWAATEELSIEHSVRYAERTRQRSEALHTWLCRQGFSLAEFNIEHTVLNNKSIIWM